MSFGIFRKCIIFDELDEHILLTMFSDCNTHIANTMSEHLKQLLHVMAKSWQSHG